LIVTRKPLDALRSIGSLLHAQPSIYMHIYAYTHMHTYKASRTRGRIAAESNVFVLGV